MRNFRIVIIGRTEILHSTALTLNKLGHEIIGVITAAAAPEYKKTTKDFEDLAKNLNIPFLLTSKINELKKFTKKLNPDIGVSVNYTSIIDKEIIDLFPFGILNVHGGDLPRYRGNACQAWAILNGEEKIGLCVHKMVGGELDSGDIISRDYVFIDSKTKIGEVLQWITLRTPGLVLEALDSLGKNSEYFLEKQENNLEKMIRCYPRRPEDGRIRWACAASDILRLINAHNHPYSGAFTLIGNFLVKIWGAELYEDNEKFNAIPGQVLEIKDDYAIIACLDSKLKIFDLEVNSKRVKPSNILRSTRDRFM